MRGTYVAAAVNRRSFLRNLGAASVALSLGPDFWAKAYAAPTVAGESPYGPLLEADENGLMLPEGFTSRVIARSLLPVAPTTYTWPMFPDGAATFRARDGGWFYAVNSEVPGGFGGVSAIKFSATGEIEDAYRVLADTSSNCAGGPTPWGTWLSCEEHDGGRVWECDPTKPGQGVVKPALGTFAHEAVAVDPKGQRLYLTEDKPDGRFYRFTPDAYPSLDAGVLEVASVGASGNVKWIPVPDPSASSAPTRSQVPESTAFAGGEGCWHDAGHVYFTTKGDNRVWVHDVMRSTIAVLYDAADFGAEAPLTGVDNAVVSAAGELFVAEDGGNMEINVITRDRVVAPFVHIPNNEASEITGPVFDPSGQRLYFSSQRGPGPEGPGITYEVAGPFLATRTQSQATATTSGPATSTTLGAAGAARRSAPAELPSTGGTPLAAPAALGALVGAGALWRLRTRLEQSTED